MYKVFFTFNTGKVVLTGQQSPTLPVLLGLREYRPGIQADKHLDKKIKKSLNDRLDTSCARQWFPNQGELPSRGARSHLPKNNCFRIKTVSQFGNF